MSAINPALRLTEAQEEIAEIADLLYRLASAASGITYSCETPNSPAYREDRVRLEGLLRETQTVLLRRGSA